MKELLRGYRLHGRVARASRVFIGQYVGSRVPPRLTTRSDRRDEARRRRAPDETHARRRARGHADADVERELLADGDRRSTSPRCASLPALDARPADGAAARATVAQSAGPATIRSWRKGRADRRGDGS